MTLRARSSVLGDLVAVACRALLGLCLVGPNLFAASIERQLPGSYVPAGPFEVKILAVPDGGTRVFSVEEELPPGWTVSLVNQGGVVDTVRGKVKWGPFFDDAARQLVFRVVPSSDIQDDVHFRGVAWFDLDSVPTAGPSRLARRPSTVIRSLPAEYTPGEGLDVELALDPASTVRVQVIEDQVPEGWAVSGITEGGVFDRVQGRVKWGPFSDALRRTLAYTATPTAETRGEQVFNGRAYFDWVEVAIDGPGTTASGLSRITRLLPDDFLPGIPFLVSNVVTTATHVRAYAVEETVPAGWTVSGLSHGGVFESRTGRIRWGPFPDRTPRALRYTVLPSEDETVTAGKFTGVGRFDEATAVTDGDSEVIVSPSRIERSAPLAFVPGGTVQVTNRVEPSPGVRTYAVEERVPEGWTVSEVSDAGVHDAVDGAIRWGPFQDAIPRSLRFKLTAPLEVAGEVALEGVGSFDGRAVDISGVVRLLPVANDITRRLPEAYVPGVDFEVVVSAVPVTSVRVYVVEDLPPAGWTVSGLSHGGVIDPVQGKVKWGPFADNTPRQLSYRLLPPDGARGTKTFAGSASWDRVVTEISGTSRLDRAINRTLLTDGGGAGAELKSPPDRTTNPILTASGQGVQAVLQVTAEGFELSVVGPGAAACLIEQSSDLRAWRPFRIGALPAAGRRTFPLESVDARGGFYRVVLESRASAGP